jgi:hypothetical protein
MEPEYDEWEIQYFDEEFGCWVTYRKRAYAIRSVNLSDFTHRVDYTDRKNERAEDIARIVDINKLKWRIVSYKYKQCTCRYDPVTHYEDM